MVTACVLFEVWTEILNITYTSVCFKGLKLDFNLYYIMLYYSYLTYFDSKLTIRCVILTSRFCVTICLNFVTWF